jgi:hypothetical protein
VPLVFASLIHTTMPHSGNRNNIIDIKFSSSL